MGDHGEGQGRPQEGYRKRHPQESRVEMSAITETEPVVNNQIGYGPISRLLDLTIGWAEFVASQEPRPETVTSETLYDLYQEAANLSEPGRTEAQEAALVAYFVRDRILPALVGYANEARNAA
jgi:hypothetical protein